MIHVFQTIIDDEQGDCLRACVASLLELSAEAMPNFRVTGDLEGALFAANQWLKPHNLALFQTSFLHAYGNWFDLDGVLAIFTVPSQRFPGAYHAVVGGFAREGQRLRSAIVHDPNPLNQPYPEDVEIHRVAFLVTRSSTLTPLAGYRDRQSRSQMP